jgi:tetratricopeptide (TPR) repeat protein
MSTSLFQEAKTLVAQGSDSQAKDKYSELILYCQNLLDSDGAQNGSELKETLALAYNNRGHLRYLSVDFDEAIEDYTKALEYNQKLAVAFYNRGQIHYRLGRSCVCGCGKKAQHVRYYNPVHCGRMLCVQVLEFAQDRPTFLSTSVREDWIVAFIAVR